MKKLILLLAFSAILQAQNVKEITVNSMCTGTLYTPEKPQNDYLVILIAGSGPTDRDGNQPPNMMNNSLKMLAEALSQSGTAVFAYDKRIVQQIKQKTADEKSMRFDDYIYDCKEAIVFFRAEYPYKKIIIAGHSEGSLIGMVAANETADAFISLSGPATSIDKKITEQIGKNAPMLKDEVEKDFAILKTGQTFKNENQMLNSIFRETVQPYMISWMKYDPVVEIAKLKIPVLIVNGDKDLQVFVSDAEALKKAAPSAKYAIIKNMNHVLKTVTGSDADNMATYNNPTLPISPELVTQVNQFLKAI
ncbi:alpha/beta hydrolase family protein [Flavobacterium silvaticum]|uniref:Alpha/beta hydrolase n=1 Tax=Flavobacterium silvaticum TaxID=1852020 RepID=A0A972JGV5_9FLAO|nr:alpha/beta hydrolase [Flavobacterium silvaticum]NMH29444.1 alpha/beta hydrolase [Flavobacterium silvaticum]